MRNRFGTFGPPHASGPSPEAIRDYQLEQARKAGWPRLECGDLDARPFGIYEDRASGRLYKLYRGEFSALLYSSTAAYFERPDGSLGYLEAVR